MLEKQVTGYPSIDKPWLDYYLPSVVEKSAYVSCNETIFDFLEKRLISQGDTVPALDYYGRKIQRSEFITRSYEWAVALQNADIKEGEIVSIYGPWFPEIIFIFMALNMLGATPYFLKLSIGCKALEDETSESKIAIVFDGMWKNVEAVFSAPKFEKVIFVSAVESMPAITRMLVKNKLKNRDVLRLIKQNNQKYMYSGTFFKRYCSNPGEKPIKALSDGNRAAFISSSSGTTSKGIVKGIVASNRAVISSIMFEDAPAIQFDGMETGDKCLCNFPPTAATSINCLVLLPLARNMQIMLEPQLKESQFYDQIMKYKPNYTIATGAFWETFFRKIAADVEKGKKVDLSFARLWIIGGEGTCKADCDWMNDLLDKCNSAKHITSGYGMSECCATVSLDYPTICGKRTVFEDGCVGIPYPTMVVGCFDEHGKEVGYRVPGELWVKSPATMIGYYKKESMTNDCLVDGWVHTGDIFEITEKGELLFRGRKTDCIKNGEETVYLFNVVAKLMETDGIKYAMVNEMDTKNEKIRLAAHIVLQTDTDNDAIIIPAVKKLQDTAKEYLPSWAEIAGYKIHFSTFKSSPTTAKKDRLYYAEQKDGYFRINQNGIKETVVF